MNRDEAVEQTRILLGFRSTVNDADIVKSMQFQQKELEQAAQLPSFLKAEDLTLTTVAGVERMSPPTGFLREWDEDALWVKDIPAIDPDHWLPLEKDTTKYLRQSLQTLGGGMPVAYDYDQTDFILFPTPDDVYTLRMIYYKSEPELTSGTDTNKWLTHVPYLLIGLAGGIIASGLRDQGAQMVFSGLIQAGMQRLADWSVDRDEAGKRQVVGGPD